MKSDMNTILEDEIRGLKDKNLWRQMRHVEGAQGRVIVVDGQEVLNFCSNNYLGLAGDVRLANAAEECARSKGFGSGASRLVCGNMSAHQRLESDMARFKETERCLIFSTGYMANVGIISSLFGCGDIIFSDRLNHASIIDGALLSRAKLKRYPHCDMVALEEMLKNNSGFKKRVIITDAIFSMDGDIAPLDVLVKLARKYDCLLMVDEAHAFGVMGKNGRGLAEHFDVSDKIDIQMGTFSKAAGCFGAYCCGSSTLISLLMNKARSFIYTTGMPPSVAAAARKAVTIIEEESLLRERLWENTHYVRKELVQMGFDVMCSQTPIIPILVKDVAKAVEFSNRLFANGIFISAIRPPTVPVNTARLRLTVMATHTTQDLNNLCTCLKTIVPKDI